MNEKAKRLILDFIREKLDGQLDNLRTFDLKTLRDSEKFGCPGRRFDCDDTEIMRAVYAALWEDLLPELSPDTLGDNGKYRGDTLNSFHTMFGREIPDRPGFYAGLENYDPSDEIRERVREFGNRYCSTVGNFAVLPNLYARNTTLNCYRGTNQWRDFFDRFLIELEKVLCGGERKDPLLDELVQTNAFCFDRFRGREGFRTLVRILLLENYCDSRNGYAPKVIFPLNYHWKDPADAETYFRDVCSYLDTAESVICSRGRAIRDILRTKLGNEVK
ncbi:MAG: hypothetical protein IJS14_08290 [Lentisphaeria bacterium]|nr:hypothetical protein [Lentisphaeria bacterium]